MGHHGRAMVREMGLARGQGTLTLVVQVLEEGSLIIMCALGVARSFKT